MSDFIFDIRNLSDTARGTAVCVTAAVVAGALASGVPIIILVGVVALVTCIGYGGFALWRFRQNDSRRLNALRAEISQDLALCQLLLQGLRDNHAKARELIASAHHRIRTNDSRALLLATDFCAALEERIFRLNEYQSCRTIGELLEGIEYCAQPLVLKQDCHSSLVFTSSDERKIPHDQLQLFASKMNRELSAMLTPQRSQNRAA